MLLQFWMSRFQFLSLSRNDVELSSFVVVRECGWVGFVVGSEVCLRDSVDSWKGLFFAVFAVS